MPTVIRNFKTGRVMHFFSFISLLNLNVKPFGDGEEHEVIVICRRLGECGDRALVSG